MKEFLKRFHDHPRFRIFIIAAGLLLAAVLLKWLLFPPQARYITAEKKSYLPSLLLSGEVVAVKSCDVTAQVSAPIQELHVSKGQQVSRGELLAVLDASEAEAELSQAEASLEYSQNHLSQENQNEAYDAEDLDNRRNQAEARIAEADLRLEQAGRELEQGRAEYNRSTALYQAGAISLQAYEQAGLLLKSQENAAALAEKECELARLEFDALQETASDVAMLESEVAQKQAALDASASRLADYYLYAPIDGQITDIFKLPNDILNAGESLLSLASTGHTRIKIQPDQRYAYMIVPGTRAEVWSQANPETRASGHIVYVKPAWDAQEGTLEAEIELDAASPGFSLGAIVTIQLIASESRAEIIIPGEYLSSLDGKAGLWIYKSGQLAFAPVTTAESNSNGTIIRTGVEAGDKIVYPDAFAEGDRVSLAEDTDSQ